MDVCMICGRFFIKYLYDIHKPLKSVYTDAELRDVLGDPYLNFMNQSRICLPCVCLIHTLYQFKHKLRAALISYPKDGSMIQEFNDFKSNVNMIPYTAHTDMDIDSYKSIHQGDAKSMTQERVEKVVVVEEEEEEEEDELVINDEGVIIDDEILERVAVEVDEPDEDEMLKIMYSEKVTRASDYSPPVTRAKSAPCEKTIKIPLEIKVKKSCTPRFDASVKEKRKGYRCSLTVCHHQYESFDQLLHHVISEHGLQQNDLNFEEYKQKLEEYLEKKNSRYKSCPQTNLEMSAPSNTESKYPCLISYCYKNYSSITELNDHKVKAHSIWPRYSCGECYKVKFTSREDLLFHNYLNHYEIDSYCIYCSDPLKNTDELQYHLETHITCKYPCQYCDKFFFSLNSARVHGKIHRNDKYKRPVPRPKKRTILIRESMNEEEETRGVETEVSPEFNEDEFIRIRLQKGTIPSQVEGLRFAMPFDDCIVTRRDDDDDDDSDDSDCDNESVDNAENATTISGYIAKKELKERASILQVTDEIEIGSTFSDYIERLDVRSESQQDEETEVTQQPAENKTRSGRASGAKSVEKLQEVVIRTIGPKEINKNWSEKYLKQKSEESINEYCITTPQLDVASSSQELENVGMIKEGGNRNEQEQQSDVVFKQSELEDEIMFTEQEQRRDVLSQETVQDRGEERILEESQQESEVMIQGLEQEGQLLPKEPEIESEIVFRETEHKSQIMSEETEHKSEVMSKETEHKSQVMSKGTEHKSQVMSKGTKHKSQVMSKETEHKSQVMSEGTEHKSQVMSKETEHKSQVMSEETEHKSQVMSEEHDDTTISEKAVQESLVMSEVLEQECKILSKEPEQQSHIISEELVQEIRVISKEPVHDSPVISKELRQERRVVSKEPVQEFPDISKEPEQESRVIYKERHLDIKDMSTDSKQRSALIVKLPIEVKTKAGDAKEKRVSPQKEEDLIKSTPSGSKTKETSEIPSVSDKKPLPEPVTTSTVGIEQSSVEVSKQLKEKSTGETKSISKRTNPEKQEQSTFFGFVVKEDKSRRLSETRQSRRTSETEQSVEFKKARSLCDEKQIIPRSTRDTRQSAVDEQFQKVVEKRLSLVKGKEQVGQKVEKQSGFVRHLEQGGQDVEKQSSSVKYSEHFGQKVEKQSGMVKHSEQVEQEVEKQTSSVKHSEQVEEDVEKQSSFVRHLEQVGQKVEKQSSSVKHSEQIGQKVEKQTSSVKHSKQVEQNVEEQSSSVKHSKHVGKKVEKQSKLKKGLEQFGQNLDKLSSLTKRLEKVGISAEVKEKKSDEREQIIQEKIKIQKEIKPVAESDFKKSSSGDAKQSTSKVVVEKIEEVNVKNLKVFEFTENEEEGKQVKKRSKSRLKQPNPKKLKLYSEDDLSRSAYSRSPDAPRTYKARGRVPKSLVEFDERIKSNPLAESQDVTPDLGENVFLENVAGVVEVESDAIPSTSKIDSTESTIEVASNLPSTSKDSSEAEIETYKSRDKKLKAVRLHEQFQSTPEMSELEKKFNLNKVVVVVEDISALIREHLKKKSSIKIDKPERKRIKRPKEEEENVPVEPKKVDASSFERFAAERLGLELQSSFPGFDLGPQDISFEADIEIPCAETVEITTVEDVSIIEDSGTKMIFDSTKEVGEMIDDQSNVRLNKEIGFAEEAFNITNINEEATAPILIKETSSLEVPGPNIETIDVSKSMKETDIPELEEIKMTKSNIKEKILDVHTEAHSSKQYLSKDETVEKQPKIKETKTSSEAESKFTEDEETKVAGKKKRFRKSQMALLKELTEDQKRPHELESGEMLKPRTRKPPKKFEEILNPSSPETFHLNPGASTENPSKRSKPNPSEVEGETKTKVKRLGMTDIIKRTPLPGKFKSRQGNIF